MIYGRINIKQKMVWKIQSFM